MHAFPVIRGRMRVMQRVLVRMDVFPSVPEHGWFTDGGICSNFPLHLLTSFPLAHLRH
jgi:hypothetical protein